MQELEPADGLDPRRVRGAGVVVDEHREGDVLVAYERRRVPLIAGTDRDDAPTGSFDVALAVTQLRDVLAAVQSTEVAQEDEYDWAFVPRARFSTRLDHCSRRLRTVEKPTATGLPCHSGAGAMTARS